MARYSGTAGGRSNIIGLKEARAHLKNLQDDMVVKDATSTKAGRGVHSILRQGVDAMRQEYINAEAAGVENADHVLIGSNIVSDGWGRLYAERKGLFFAEFGSGINLNSGTPRGEMFGYTPASWSTGETGKGYLTGGRLVLFKGWWPVKKSVKGAEMREFVTSNGKFITRRVKQGNAPVNGAEAAVKKMHEVAAKTMKHFFELK